MARSSILSAYLATLNPTEKGMVGPNTPPRPKGAVIWARCSRPDQLTAMQTLANRLADDGEMITVVPTLDTSTDPTIQPNPNTKRATRAFLDYWRPQIVIWVGGPLDPAPLFEIHQSKIPILLVDVNSTDIDKTPGRLVPGLMRNLLAATSQTFAQDAATQTRLVKAGSDVKNISVTGMLEDGIAPPDYDEAKRAELSDILGSRPIWFATKVPKSELEMVARAHRGAGRRAHRTLLILEPRDYDEGLEIVTTLRADGFSVAHGAAQDLPRESTQIFVADTKADIGLWCRLAPMTYLGGSLTDGQTSDPFVPATVGSAVLAGPKVTKFKAHYDRLLGASALQPVVSETELGRAVESLLAPDFAAQIAHNAWDVTSRGADATRLLVDIVYQYLDEVNA